MWALILLCIGINIASGIYQTSADCAEAVETVQQEGGPDPLTASDTEIDIWLEENPGAWELMEEVDRACWEE